MSVDVKALRDRLGITQVQLAARVGVAVQAVKQWEGGYNAPKGQRLARLIDLQREADRRPAAVVAPPPAAAPPPSTPGADPTRRELRIGEAVRLMGLAPGSDRTIRNAILSGALPGHKAPGYRASIAEWCFYADDFEKWRDKTHNANRDPRGGHQCHLCGAPSERYPNGRIKRCECSRQGADARPQ